jgi:hypothetical protein
MATVAALQAVHETLLDKLQYLAGLWRRLKSEEVVRRYQAVYITLAELGYDEELDVESLIPDQHMPKEYFERIERINAVYQQTQLTAQPK